MMFLLYIKQALYMLRESRLVSAVSIVGTGLAIALVMVMFMLYQIQTANYAPEVSRDKTLYISVRSYPKPGVKGETNNTGFSYNLIREHLYNLRTPEVITVSNYGREVLLAMPARKQYADFEIRWTDANFWKMYRFSFLEGVPYTQEEVEAGLPLVVLGKDVAEQLFLDESAIGQTVEIDLKPYRVVGVVDNVSRAASFAYAQLWGVLTSNGANMTTKNEDTVGPLSLEIKVHNRKDFESVRKELTAVLKQYSDNNREYIIEPRIKTFLESKIGTSREFIWQGLLMILFLLLLPAINLTGITMNNIHQRSAEIGIRKSFGATRNVLILQILMENLVITAIGAVLGLILSFIFIHIGRSFLLTSDTMLTIEMLLNPSIFGAAVIFCLLMNLLSAGVPAWRMAKQPIIYSLTGKTN